MGSKGKSELRWFPLVGQKDTGKLREGRTTSVFMNSHSVSLDTYAGYWLVVFTKH